MRSKGRILPNLGIRRNTDATSMTLALAGTTAPAEIAKNADEMVGTTLVDPIVFDGQLGVASLKVGNTYSLPLSSLRISPNNARNFYRTGEIDEMGASLLRDTQEVPAVGYVSGQHVTIIDGQKRFMACTQSGIPSLVVYIITQPASESEEWETSRRINLHRSAQTAFDDAVKMDELLRKGAYADQVALAKTLGMNPSTLSKYMQLNRIPERHRRMLIEYPAASTLKVAYEISAIFDGSRGLSQEECERIADDVIDIVVKKSLSATAVQALVASKMGPAKKRQRGQTMPVKFGGVGGVLKLFPMRGELGLSIKGLSEERVHALHAKISEILDK